MWVQRSNPFWLKKKVVSNWLFFFCSEPRGVSVCANLISSALRLTINCKFATWSRCPEPTTINDAWWVTLAHWRHEDWDNITRKWLYNNSFKQRGAVHCVPVHAGDNVCCKRCARTAFLSSPTLATHDAGVTYHDASACYDAMPSPQVKRSLKVNRYPLKTELEPQAELDVKIFWRLDPLWLLRQRVMCKGSY